MDRHFITPSGSAVHIRYDSARPTDDHDSWTVDLEVSSTATTGPAQVILDAPPLTSLALRSATGADLTKEVLDELVVVSVLQAVDQDPLLVGSTGQTYKVVIDAGNVASIASPPRLADREIRRWLARRVYDEYSRADLDILVRFDGFDHRITGTSVGDLWRNAQLLGEEGYFRIERGMGAGNYALQATAKLIREVERYGSAKDDVVSEADYVRLIDSHACLVPYREEILLEYRRHVAAASPAEVASVFRAIAPVVERLLRAVLRQKGVTRDLPTLGSLIAELKNRHIGDSFLYSQLNHVLKFARDLEEHGNAMRESVLRIACANAFELLPQIAAL